MFDLVRLTLVRQRRVAQTLAELVADEAATRSLHAEVREALRVTVETGAMLELGQSFNPLLLDTTTDGVFGGFERILDGTVRGLNDRVIKPLTPAQARKRAAALTLQQRIGATYKGYLNRSMPLQYKAMRAIVDLLRTDAECLAAVQALGLDDLVAHMEAHLGPYGRAVKAADGRDLEALADAFHAALTRLALRVFTHYEGDAAVQKRLLGAYETELAAQREDGRAARQRRDVDSDADVDS